jgi:dipeptidyl aminopeptidase
MVNLKFLRDWNDYLACGLSYIVVIVDGRGTGFRGRKLRNPVKGNLGYWETIDQIATARLVAVFSAFFFLFLRESLCRYLVNFVPDPR